MNIYAYPEEQKFMLRLMTADEALHRGFVIRRFGRLRQNFLLHIADDDFAFRRRIADLRAEAEGYKVAAFMDIAGSFVIGIILVTILRVIGAI